MDEKGLSYETELKYVQSEELELTWKAEKRERIKLREQRIWEQFVQEKDIVGVLCKDDPYQFVEDLPESYILDQLEKEFQNIKNAEIEVDNQSQDNYSENQGDVASAAVDSEVDNVYYMYYGSDNESGPEEELNASMDDEQCTVRETQNEPDVAPPPLDTPTSASGDRVTGKSSTNVANLIDNSVYCSKIKELQMSIYKEAVDMISFLETAPVDIEPEDVGKLTRRCGEFCVRLQRAHVYQLQRQLRDIQRHADAARAGGGARHTLARALCVRLVSLLQSVLHALQAVGKLVQAGGWCDAAGGLLAVLRDGAAPQLHAAAGVTGDAHQNMAAICERLEAGLSAHAARVAEYLNNLTTLRSSSYADKTSRSNKKKFIGARPKNNTRAADQRLSMYSHYQPRPRRALTARTTLSGASKSRITAEDRVAHSKDPPKKTNAKPRVRRRAPADPQTLVEAVEVHSLSQLATPQPSARSEKVPPLNITTPKRSGKTRKQANRTSQHGDDGDKEEKTLAPYGDMDGDKVAEVHDSVIKEVQELCSGDASNRNNGSEPKNVRLVCVTSRSPLKSTPRKEKIIADNEQVSSRKEVPSNADNEEKYRMTLDVPQQVKDSLMQYRSKHMEYMLSSALYTNSSLRKPLKMITSVSDKIVDDLLLNCVKEMELKEFTEELCKSEMN